MSTETSKKMLAHSLHVTRNEAPVPKGTGRMTPEEREKRVGEIKARFAAQAAARRERALGQAKNILEGGNAIEEIANILEALWESKTR